MYNNVKVLIIGSDANAYYMARCAHEVSVNSIHLIAKEPFYFTNYSKIFSIEYHNDLWDTSRLLFYINQFAEHNSDYKILLVGTNDTYVKSINDNQANFLDNIYCSKRRPELLESLQNKELFYKKYKNCGLNFPETWFYNIKDNNWDSLELPYPVIIKPSNVILYNHIDFANKKKVFRAKNKNEFKACIELLINSGYNAELIIQEYIPGDDTYMFDSVMYFNQNGNPVLQSFAQVALQDRTPGAVGNITCMINNYSSFKNSPVEETKKELIKFLQTINYTGFADADIKYDARINKFVVLEFNVRQGRGSYYVSACGQNLIQILIDDLINNIDSKFNDIPQRQVLTYVPKFVVNKFVKNNKLKEQLDRNWKNKVNPIEYQIDNSLKRKIELSKRKLKYYYDYNNAYWDPL